MTTDSSNGNPPVGGAILTGDGAETQTEFLRSILNNVPAGIAILDGTTLRLTWANQAFSQLVAGATVGAALPPGF